ncbi:MAG: hypothetical protein K2N47_00425, partial [Clostridia bacterium]|nr:hypothetical protein [Clostridia bacterium]
LARSIENKLDYETLASAVAEKLNPAFMAANTGDQIDAEELAREIADKLNVSADINEDTLAEKAAAVISNYMPEIDTDDIADKVIAGVIPALPNSPVLDDDLIVNSISERIVENPEGDFNVVIDEESITRISEEVNRENEGRFNKIDDDVEEIKEMLRSGVLVARTENTYVENYEPVEETVEEEVVEEEVAEEPEEEAVEETTEEIVVEPVEETVEETAEDTEEEPVEEPFEEPVEEEEEQLVTVSDIVGEEEELEEETSEEDSDENDGNNLVINAIVDDIDEDPTDGEVMPDGIPGISGGVDFANMMKYNRSFIARIIQGTDDQKNFYGRTKTALLSYKKVNSNIAWGAERFNKGRETIARFKIRGKTLCLYLALDPNEYAKSVYNHVDVSDNKSMHGTPMMVKIKSPLGVKKAIRLIDEMLAKRDGVKRNVAERDYAAMYPYETIEELIEDGLVKDVNK